jgi:hypothetical protein
MNAKVMQKRMEPNGALASCRLGHATADVRSTGPVRERTGKRVFGGTMKTYVAFGAPVFPAVPARRVNGLKSGAAHARQGRSTFLRGELASPARDLIRSSAEHCSARAVRCFRQWVTSRGGHLKSAIRWNPVPLPSCHRCRRVVSGIQDRARSMPRDSFR